MRKLLLILVAFIMLHSMALADEGAAEGVKRVKAYVEKLGRHEVRFNVLAGELIYVGQYHVDGDSYYIQMDNVEVYSDGKVRHEVDNERKEVSIDVMDSESRNILDNPTRCFDFAESEYRSEIQSRKDGELTIFLRATDTDVEGDIYLTIEEKSGKPRKIVYRLYDDEVEVTIDSIVSVKQPLKKFSKNQYKGYEIVDFR